MIVVDPRSATAAQRASLARHGIHVEQAFLIGRTPAELYAYWRDFANLPRFMSHLERVDVLDERRSRWIARAPRLGDSTVTWEAEITADEPGSLIAWRSLPRSDVATSGQVRFARALGDRGTEVHVDLDYLPPGGRFGHWVATLAGKGPGRQIREDLRNFKRLMETGEIPTIAGQPRGTCRGHGRRELS